MGFTFQKGKELKTFVRDLSFLKRISTGYLARSHDILLS